MYLSQADVLEMDHDQLVGKILMRMTPWQFENLAVRVEEGALGGPVLAGNLVYNLDGRRRCS